MGFIEKYDPTTYRSSYPLFSDEECDRLTKILLRDERMVLSIPNNQESSYTGTTHQFPVYNWLNNIDLEQFDIPKRLFTLPEFRQEKVLYVQCWVNILRQGENISTHCHGDENLDLTINNFYASNTFISGPTTTGTHYNDTYERNTKGTMHLIGSMVEHGVSTHMSNTPRISMAMDIYHDNHPIIQEQIESTTTDFISPMNMHDRIKRIENRFQYKS